MNRKPCIDHAFRSRGASSSARSYLAAALIAAAMLAPAAAWARDQGQVQNVAGHAQDGPEKPKDETLDKAGKIVSQPVRDVGITKTKIAPVLQAAVSQPYGPAGNGKCAAIVAELARLNAALGPDFDANTKANEDKAEKLALAGGEFLVNAIIPFRGVVREISGAAPAERRKAAAVAAGTARRGYLRGIAVSKGCKLRR